MNRRVRRVVPLHRAKNAKFSEFQHIVEVTNGYMKAMGTQPHQKIVIIYSFRFALFISCALAISRGRWNECP